jgi:rhodanese-related sulfurtransferase
MERTIKPEDFKVIADTVTVLDVRRKEDHAASVESVPGAQWRDPAQIDQWIDNVPRDQDVVIYCVRGGSASNTVVDRLQACGVQARFIEGGIEGFKAAGGELTHR